MSYFKKFHVGFTGTRSGMSEKQLIGIYEYVKTIYEITEDLEASHGDCIGSDEQFHVIVRCFTKNIHIYPGHSAKKDPSDTNLRAYCKEGIIYPSQTHFKRNRVIATISNVLLACPYNNIEKGGTWYTINYARKIKKSVIIFSRE